MNEEREYFVFFSQSLASLNNAWRVLQEIREQEGCPILIGASFRFALIEYCKPYKRSRGNLKAWYTLNEIYIPPEYLPLHRRILDARDQILAHSDLTVLDARVYVKDSPAGKIAGYSLNRIDGLEEARHLSSVIDLIERTLDNMYLKEEELKRGLAADPGSEA